MNLVVFSFLLFLLPTIGLAQSFSSSSTSGSGGTPGGANTQLQYNNAGAFGGLSTLTWDGTKFSLSAQLIDSTNGAASTPPISMTGTWFTGGTETTTKPHFLIEPAGTTSTGWNAAGTGFGVNAPAGFTGNIADFQIGGVSSVSFIGPSANPSMKLDADTFITRMAGGTVSIGTSAGATTGAIQTSIYYVGNGANGLFYSGGMRFARSTNATIGWAATNATGAADTMFSAPSAAMINMGAADSSSPVAQTFGVQSVVAGTSNVAGADWTIKGSAGTGTGVGGNINFKVAPAGGSGTAQNAYVTGLTIDGTTGHPIVPNKTVANLPTCNAAATGAIAYVTDQLTACPALDGTFTGGGAVKCFASCNGTAWVH